MFYEEHITHHFYHETVIMRMSFVQYQQETAGRIAFTDSRKKMEHLHHALRDSFLNTMDGIHLIYST